MKSVSFSVEIGVNAGFNQRNRVQSVTIDELGALLQKIQREIEEETGIPITTVVSGPNRSCYRTDWDAPEGGELTYTIRGNSDHRIQLQEEPVPEVKWKRAVLLLVDRVRTYYAQEYALVEFIGGSGVDSYVFSPECGLDRILQENALVDL